MRCWGCSVADSIKVALIAADGDSARRLRDMLAGLDCTSVYDAPAGEFDPVTLATSEANVVIVDLTPDAEIDAIYDLLDDQRYRVIFNEAAVTSRLSGWEHARWVRHLAAKILQLPEVVDPPRPSEGSFVAAAGPAVAPSFPASIRPADVSPTDDNVDQLAAELGIDDWLSEVMQAKGPTNSFVLAQPGLPLEELVHVEEYAPDRTAEPAADEPSPRATRNGELDALMASAIETLGSDQEVQPAVKPAAEERFDWQLEDVIRDIDEWLPPGLPAAEVRSVPAGAAARLWSPDKAQPDEKASADSEGRAKETKESNEFAADLQLEPMSEDVHGEPPLSAKSSTASAAPLSAQPFGATSPARTDRIAAFAAPAFSALPSLELAPMDDDSEAPPVFAARPLANDQEMRIDVVAETGAPSRVIVLCASVGGPEAIRELLGALPASYPALFLVVQQVGEEFLDLLSQQLRRATRFRVRGAELGDQLRDGDVVPVSPRQRLLINRRGRVASNERLDVGSAAPTNQLLRDVSDNFGADCAVIVLSGIASDVADGCRYLASHGGRVYAQAASSCVASAMVEQVQQTGVVNFQGTPAELASRLLIDFSRG